MAITVWLTGTRFVAHLKGGHGQKKQATDECHLRCSLGDHSIAAGLDYIFLDVEYERHFVLLPVREPAIPDHSRYFLPPRLKEFHPITVKPG